MRLYIGNNNYSSWSLRPWLLMRHTGMAFEEEKASFADLTIGDRFHRWAAQLSPTARVPVLEDQGQRVWDSLAIIEYLAETHPDLAIWPRERGARARARSVCAEMHAGFTALRRCFPMNFELLEPAIGPDVLAREPDAVRDVQRIDALFADALAASGGPWLFGAFSAADAYYAPVASRIRSYGLPLSATSAAYAARVLALPALEAWEREALEEHDYVAIDEPYRAPDRTLTWRAR